MRDVPENRLLTETDGPFIERDGQPIPAGDVLPVLNGIAAINNRDVSEVRSQVVENLRELTLLHAQ